MHLTELIRETVRSSGHVSVIETEYPSTQKDTLLGHADFSASGIQAGSSYPLPTSWIGENQTYN